MRLFMAILPDAPSRAALAALAAMVPAHSRAARPVRPENLHLTLAFIGETRLGRVAIECLDALKAAPFEVRLADLGRFPGRDGEAVWAGICPNDALMAAQHRLATALRAAGFSIDDKPYRPHITLARRVVFHSPAGFEALQRATRQNAPAVGFAAEWFSLMRSERIDGRLTYTEIASKRLGPDG